MIDALRGGSGRHEATPVFFLLELAKWQTPGAKNRHWNGGLFPVAGILFHPHPEIMTLETPNRRRKKGHSYRDGGPPVNKGVLKHLRKFNHRE